MSSSIESICYSASSSTIMSGEALLFECELNLLIFYSLFAETSTLLLCELTDWTDATLPKLKLIVLDFLKANLSEACDDLLSSTISCEPIDSSTSLNGLSSEMGFFYIGTAEPPNLGLTIYLNFKEKAGSLLTPKKFSVNY